ncbi:hypothetical protein [Vreelandella venusta]|uniref:hypothetical protein n=1 Tax=Vreelandella venusta TaxID=44935 RepID=UPI00116EBDF8|nr:hypothetical protein [Halomonas venusta]GEK52362.1 hypothetical protein HVE01_30830 [Halomonas venusta]
MTPMTPEQFKQALPPTIRKNVNQEVVDKVNAVLSEPELYEQYRENLISYSHVMKDGKFKITSYVDAVKYISHKLMGRTNIDAYSRTFPDKMVRFANQGVSQKDISAYVSAYNKSKLVNLIYEQSLIPSWVLNQDMYQKALNIQFELAQTAASEKVRSDAANSLLTHLKKPETHKVELDIGVKEDSSIAALREATMALAKQSRMAIESGAMDAQQVAHEKVIIDGEAEVKDGP